MTELLYHVVPADEWDAARLAGRYAPVSLETEGFIHLSTAHQVEGTIDRYYRGVAGLVLLEIDAGRLMAEVRYEQPRPGEWFPHLYGPLDLDAVVRVIPIQPEASSSRG